MMSWCSVYSAWPVLFKGEATSRVHVDDKFTTCSCYAVSSWVHCVGLQLHHSYNLWKKLLISLGPTIWFCQNHSAGQCSSSTKDHQTVTLTSSHGYQQGTHTTNKITANRWHHMDINGTHTTRDWQDYCQQVTSHGHQPDTHNTSLTGLLPTAGITRTPTRHTHHVTDRITADRWHHTDTNRTHTLHITDRITANRWHHTHYTSLTGLLPTGDIIHQWDNIRKGQNT